MRTEVAEFERELETEFAETIIETPTSCSYVPEVFPRIEKGAELAATHPPEPDPILEGVFDAADKVPVIGSSKSRKTFFTLQLALALASAKPGAVFLGFRISKRRRVFYVNLEIKGTHMHRRMYRLARNMGIDPDELKETLLIANGRGTTVSNDWLARAAVNEMKADVIIIDPLYKMLRGDENKAEDMKPCLAAFDSLAESTGAAVMYVHHNPKGRAGDRDVRDRGAGSGVLARDFDAALYLTDHSQGYDLLVLSALARNYPPVAPVSIEWKEGRFALSDAPPLEQTTATARKAGRVRVEPAVIVEKMEASGPLSVSDTVETLRAMGMTREPARDFYRRLVSDGLLTTWREPVLHGVTWIGTTSQIRKKRDAWQARPQDLPDFPTEHAKTRGRKS